MASPFVGGRRVYRLPQKTLLSSSTFGYRAIASLRRLTSFRSRFNYRLSVRLCQENVAMIWGFRNELAIANERCSHVDKNLPTGARGQFRPVLSTFPS